MANSGLSAILKQTPDQVKIKFGRDSSQSQTGTSIYPAAFELCFIILWWQKNSLMLQVV